MNLVKRNYVFPKSYNPFFDDDLFFKWDSLWPEVFDQKNSSVVIKPKADITDGENEYSIELEMPGITKDNLKISTENQYVIVEACREETKNESKNLYSYSEIKRGNFRRSFLLPSEADTNPDNIAATYKNGILKLTFQKKREDKNEKTINVKFE